MGCKAVVVCQCRVEWLSRWLLMAHWRCTKAFDLSASLPCTLAGLSTLSILVSVSRASFSFPLPFLSSSLSLPLDLASSRPSACITARAAVRSSLFLSFSPSNEYTRTYTCERSPPSVVSTLSSTPVSFPRPLRPTPPATPPLGCFLTAPRNPGPQPRRLERIARYDLHSSRNKTSTTLLNDKRNRALSVL